MMPFWISVRLAEGKGRSELKLVLIPCISELDMNRSQFLLLNMSMESIYWDWSGKTFNCLKNS